MTKIGAARAGQNLVADHSAVGVNGYVQQQAVGKS